MAQLLTLQHIYACCCVEFLSHFSRFLFQDGPFHACKNGPPLFPCAAWVFTCEFQFFRSFYVGAPNFVGTPLSQPFHDIGLSSKKPEATRLLASNALSLWLFIGFFGSASLKMPVKHMFLKRALCDLDFFHQHRFTGKDVPMSSCRGHFENRPF